MKPQLVIAFYNENINWIKPLINKYDIYIYHKGDKIPDFVNKLIKKNKIKYKKLKNVGRESHSYIYHILKYEDNLPDKIFFTQAEPFDHIETNELSNEQNFYNILDDFFENDYDFKGYGKKHWEWERGLGNKVVTMEKLWSDMFVPQIYNFKFNNGGIFGVQKYKILCRNRDFYKYCLYSLDKEKNPMEGFCFERLWSIIFDKNIISKI